MNAQTPQGYSGGYTNASVDPLDTTVLVLSNSMSYTRCKLGEIQQVSAIVIKDSHRFIAFAASTVSTRGLAFRAIRDRS